MKKFLLIAIVLGACSKPVPPVNPPGPTPQPVAFSQSFGQKSSLTVTVAPGAPGTVKEYKLAIGGALK